MTEDQIIPVGSPLHASIVEFLYREAYLLDDGHFSEWLELFADDIEYRMPVRTTVKPSRGTGFSAEMEFFTENHASLETRVRRLATDRAWAEQPASRTRHLVTNVLVEHGDHEDELRVRTAFFVARTHGDKPYDFYSGERRDVIRQVDDRFLIAARDIYLDQTVLHSYNLSIFF